MPYEKSIYAMSNDRSVVEPLDATLKKALLMHSSQAYIHQYEKRGMSNDDFVDAFISIEQILANYGRL